MGNLFSTKNKINKIRINKIIKTLKFYTFICFENYLKLKYIFLFRLHLKQVNIIINIQRYMKKNYVDEIVSKKKNYVCKLILKIFLH